MGSGWLAYAQLLDSALPIGGFSHSFGLETMVQEGRLNRPQDLRRYLSGMLANSWAPGDAMGVKAVYEYGPLGQWDRLWELDRMLHLSRMAVETREGQLKMGRRLLHLARSIHPDLMWEPLAGAAADGRCFGVHSVVHGWAAWQLGVTLDQAAEGYLYACLVMAVGSALRLMSIGQTEGQAVLASMLPEASAAWALHRDRNPMDFYTAAPEADIDMMRHEGLYSRLFMS